MNTWYLGGVFLANIARLLFHCITVTLKKNNQNIMSMNKPTKTQIWKR